MMTRAPCWVSTFVYLSIGAFEWFWLGFLVYLKEKVNATMPNDDLNKLCWTLYHNDDSSCAQRLVHKNNLTSHQGMNGMPCTEA